EAVSHDRRPAGALSHGENQVSVAMKHVREDLPDVSKRRPEVSAGLAAILDPMTSKDLRKRYPDALSLQADLEEALARELSRTGKSTGEATAVLRTLPESARRRVPVEVRRARARRARRRPAAAADARPAPDRSHRRRARRRGDTHGDPDPAGRRPHPA